MINTLKLSSGFQDSPKCYCLFMHLGNNPLTLKNDQHVISPYNTTLESHMKVAGTKETISN